MAILSAALAVAGVSLWLWQYPILRIAFVWIAIVWAGNLVKFVYNVVLSVRGIDGGNKATAWLASAWAVLQTFAFITFTRLFFRSGSNLDPQEANTHAWNTANNMVGQIGGKWHFDVIPDMIWGYRSVFVIFILGMIVHWLPERFKRRYRLWFSAMPLWAVVVAVVLTVFVLYQFVSADLQRFIYFQF